MKKFLGLLIFTLFSFVSASADSAELKSRQSQNRKIIEECSRVIATGLAGVETFKRRADAFHNDSDYEPEILDRDTVIKLMPSDSSAYSARAAANEHILQYRKCIEDCNLAIQLDPRNWLAYAVRGSVKATLEQYEKSLDDLNTAIKLNPKDAASYGNRARSFGLLGKFEPSIRDCNEAIRLAPKQSKWYASRACAYGLSGQYQRSVDDCKRALELDPNDVWGHKNLGWAYAQLNLHEMAIAECRKVIQLEPSCAQAYRNRAGSYEKLGLYQLAIADYSKLISLSPMNEEIYSRRTDACVALGKATLESTFVNISDVISTVLNRCVRSPHLPFRLLDFCETLVNNFEENFEVNVWQRQVVYYIYGCSPFSSQEEFEVKAAQKYEEYKQAKKAVRGKLEFEEWYAGYIIRAFGLQKSTSNDDAWKIYVRVLYLPKFFFSPVAPVSGS